MSGLTGPRTAVRGNQIAAVGMAVAVIATLLRKGEFDGSGTVSPDHRRAGDRHRRRRPRGAQREDDRDAADGGAVQRRRRRRGGADRLGREFVPPPRWRLAVARGEPGLFGAIVGSISFWGSGIAFAKLQEILPGRPIKLPGQAAINAVLLLIAIVSAVVLSSGTHSQLLFIVGILVVPALLGNLLVLPIGGADMPVVISLLNAFTGLSAAATGVALSTR